MSRSPHAGLTAAQASARLQDFGPNEMPSNGGRSLWRIVPETMREPMFLLLLGASLLYLLLGSLGEGLFLTAGAVLSVGLVIVQESRSERALAALQQIAQPMARVLRDGNEMRLPARELAPGDLLLIGEGERLPADGVLIGGEILSVDESALTGESAPVTKCIGLPQAALASVEPGVDAVPQVFAGTLVVRGQATVLVSHTGERSALGRIGRSLADIQHELTPLQQTAGRLVGILGMVALAFCALVASSYGLLRDIREALFGFQQIRTAVLQGLVVLVAVFGLYAWCHSAMLPEGVARAAAFTAMVIANLVLALADSAASLRWFAAYRRIFWSIALVVCIALAAILGIPAFGAVFQVAMPDWQVLVAAIGIGIVSGGWPQLAQAVRSRHN